MPDRVSRTSGPGSNAGGPDAEGNSSLIGREVFLASLIGDVRGLGVAMRRAALRMQDVHLEAGEFVYRAGQRATDFFFVVSGEIELTREGTAPLREGPREIIGALAATVGKLHVYDARATKPSHVLRLRAEEWTELLEDNFDLTRRAIFRTSSRVYQLRLRPPPLGGFDPPAPARARPDGSGAEGDLQVIDRILHLREVPAFARAGIQTLAVLAQLGSTTFAAENAVMFAAGELRGHLAVIASGEVRVSWPASPVEGHFGPTSLLGGAAALSDSPIGEVRSLSPARAIVLPLEDYFDVMEEHFTLAQSALVALAQERELLLGRGT